jgi:flagellar hook assembly protein FlgD
MDKDSVTTAIGDGDGAVADKFELRQNYPNPFNPTTTVSFTLDQPSEVSLVIYNMLGQKVKTLYQGKANAGTVTRIWDGMNEAGGRVASGVYFYQLKTENRVVTKKMTLLK